MLRIDEKARPDDVERREGRPQPISWGFSQGDEISPGLHAWDLIGGGRCYETWIAWCVRRWSAVVVKLPRPDAVTEGTRDALSREAALVASLAHPSILRLLEARPGDSPPHLLFEYVEGPTLAHILDEEGPQGSPDVIRLGMQIASALHYLHGRGFVHLDIKPENMTLRDGRVILLDLDIASPIGDGRSRTKAQGTPPYMAPEQVLCEPASPSMDLFALGAVLYEALTDVVAFDVAGEGSDHIYPQLTQSPAPPRSIVAGIPEATERAVMALLRRDPAERPSTAIATLALLQDSLAPGESGLWPAWADHLLAAGGSLDKR